MNNAIKALDDAKQDFPPLVKTRTADTGKYSYRYIDLGTLMDAVIPVLRDHGFMYLESLSTDGLVTELYYDETDQVIRSILPIPTGLSSQAMGSAITYARRYNLVTILSLVIDDDDDGAKAQAEARAVERVMQAFPAATKVGDATTNGPAAQNLPPGW